MKLPPIPGQIQTVYFIVVVVIGRAIEGDPGSGHELPEDADRSVPEGGLGEMTNDTPGASLKVKGLYDTRQFKGVVITSGDNQPSPQGSHTSPNVDLGQREKTKQD